jgi:hypothetical protein
MRVRVERDVTSELVGDLLEPVDPELGAKDSLQGDAADARSSKTGEVPKRGSTQAWGTTDVGHEKLVTRVDT